VEHKTPAKEQDGTDISEILNKGKQENLQQLSTNIVDK